MSPSGRDERRAATGEIQRILRQLEPLEAGHLIRRGPDPPLEHDEVEVVLRDSEEKLPPEPREATGAVDDVPLVTAD